MESCTYPELFEKYPNQWILVKALERDETGFAIRKMLPIMGSLSKKEIISKARELKKNNEDVAVISTIETLEEAKAFVYFDNKVEETSYVSPREYCLIFQLYYGLQVAPEYLEED